MGTIANAFNGAFRDYTTAGVPASGDHEPVKSEIRGVGPVIETAIAAAALGSAASVVKTTRALLYADLAYVAGTVASVYADPTEAFNDLYVKSGASGAGAWTPTNLLHNIVSATLAASGGKYVYLNRTGLSTGDAIAVTSQGGLAVTAYNERDLYVFNVLDANTVENPTLNINGIGAKPLRTATGGNVPIGYWGLFTHMAVRYQVNTDEFRVMFKSPDSGSDDTRSTFAFVEQTNVSGFDLELSLVSPVVLDPFATLYAFQAVTAHAEGGVSVEIAQINPGDPRQMRTVTGAQITPGTWQVGDTILFRFIDTGLFELVGVLAANAGSGGTASANTTTALYARANSNIYALAAFGK